MVRYCLKSSFALVVASVLAACEPGPPQHGELTHTSARLQREALRDDRAWELVESLATEIGPRMAGSEGDRRAVEWARQRFLALQFDRVWLEHVSFPLWRRQSESAALVSPVNQPLAVTALGGSPGTGGPIRGEVVHFPDLAALEAAAPDSLEGKIAFISQRMQRTRDGLGYMAAVDKRSHGPFVAAEQGALALLIRSVGTDAEGPPHTGQMSTQRAGEPVPAAALSNADADRVEEMLAGGLPVVITLDLDCGFDGMGESRNVIGEFDGSGDTGGFVVVGAHLDSWDLGTGAVDDGSGVAITMAAARLVAELPERPRHGIRVVLFANEEQGVYGGKAYAAAHRSEWGRHVLAAESDLGAGRIWSFRTRTAADAQPAVQQLADLLAPLDIAWDAERPAFGGADLSQMSRLGVPVVDLQQDASRYFDVHHSASDTLAAVDPADLRQNVAAWATLIYWAASSDVALGPIAPTH